MAFVINIFVLRPGTRRVEDRVKHTRSRSGVQTYAHVLQHRQILEQPCGMEAAAHAALDDISGVLTGNFLLIGYKIGSCVSARSITSENRGSTG